MLANVIGPDRAEAWRWWERRRLHYNLVLAGAGCAAYAAFWVVMVSFGQASGIGFQQIVSMTVLMGIAFLIAMGVANILYLLGVVIESLARPDDVESFRETTWNLGFWGSVALPFLFPLAVWATMLANEGPI